MPHGSHVAAREVDMAVRYHIAWFPHEDGPERIELLGPSDTEDENGH